MNMVGLLAASGDADGALVAADSAAPVLRGADADRLVANRAFALARSGHMDEALRTARRALAGIRAGTDPVVLAGLLSTIGLTQVYRGELNSAESALTEAAVTADQAGLTLQAAMARGNLAFAASRRGDLPRALALYAAVEPDLTPERVAQCRFDRAETLITAGLAAEARALLGATLVDVADRGHRADTADGLLLLARAELADGDPGSAARTARRASAEFARQDRTGWIPLADHLGVRARWAAGDRSPDLLRAARTAADRLGRAGWAEPAADTRIVAALIALHLGRTTVARDLLGRVSTARWHGPVATRVAAWHATALERASRGDRRGAAAAVRAGLLVVDDHAAALGATELRARAADLAADLAGLGLRQARSGRELLAAEERRRAITCRPASVRPPADPRLAAALADLRRASAEHTEATATGHGSRETADRIPHLEAAVRASARTRPGAGAGTRTSPPRIAELTEALGHRALVEFVRLGPELHAVTVVAGRCRRWPLGRYEDAVRAARLVRFDLRVLAERGGDHVGRAKPGTAAALAEEQLIGPLRRAIGDRELVISSTGALHALPWAALPALAARPVTVVPSARTWVRRSAPPPGGRGRGEAHRVVLVAGPGLRHADTEITALARIHPDATVLTGGRARAETVRRALDGGGLAHVAAHGEFRVDNPLFSRLLLADGPLIAYDLEGLRRAPRVVVLSACDAGRADAGEAVMGMVGVLLDFGAATVIASVTPVRDADTRDFMVAFHERLAAGVSPARALAVTPRTPGVLGFVCFGAG
ncbi:CHAT domain-containing protein [Actinomadura alba]|uniref:CHAT domain-containing protein n=2 Tax=Actinomadura alba TaxID=406431 RepID=A0ABR7LKM1_9ACTN|nr:CHAT domain-containing protein [Actinomadura alba]